MFENRFRALLLQADLLLTSQIALISSCRRITALLIQWALGKAGLVVLQNLQALSCGGKTYCGSLSSESDSCLDPRVNVNSSGKALEHMETFTSLQEKQEAPQSPQTKYILVATWSLGGLFVSIVLGPSSAKSGFSLEGQEGTGQSLCLG